jgi:hypothetical protein
MNQKRELNRLNRHAFAVGLASLVVVLIGIVAFLLFLDPTLIGIAPGPAAGYQGNLIWLFLAILLFLPGLAFILVVVRWTYRLKWIYRSQKSRPMRLRVVVKQDRDSTYYDALLHSVDATSGESEWRASIWVKPKSMKDDLGKEFAAQVYDDPRTAKPALIEYENGILWIMAGSGSVTKIT